MKVRDVEESVALCFSLKQEGKYDWFRGQRRNSTIIVYAFGRDATIRGVAANGPFQALDEDNPWP